jgi:hypothetical protein
MPNDSRRFLPSFVPLLLVMFLLAAVFFCTREETAPAERWAGTARVDITPLRPVRLTGYAGRSGPHTGVVQPLWAKALAIGGAGDAPALWLTLDNCGITREIWMELRSRISHRTGVPPERIVMTISHTHSAPATTGWAPFIQPENLTPAESAAFDDYTREMLDKLESVAASALENRFTAMLSWNEGRVGFAANRRTQGGPVDHALPVLKVTDADGNLRALAASYACHCTTCGGEVMQACGDWAGYAQEALERDHPGAVALIAIGCGADSNPSPRGGPDGGIALARQHGESLAAEVRRLLAAPFRPLPGHLTAALMKAPLPFVTHFTREEWKQRAQAPDITGRHARHWLARQEAGETLPSHLEYEVTTWRFGDDLNMLFLPGEVVVDYSLRLKREAGTVPLWINAYSNWVPCYIPSRRILSEGGYEAESSLWYYNRPARLAPDSEEIIVQAARQALQAAAGKSP